MSFMGKRLITLLTMLLALTTVSAQDFNQIDTDGNVTRRVQQAQQRYHQAP